MQGQVFLKGRGGGGGGGNFHIKFFKGLPFLHSEITLPFAKLCYAFKENYGKNVILSCVKMNLEISHK